MSLKKLGYEAGFASQIVQRLQLLSSESTRIATIHAGPGNLGDDVMFEAARGLYPQATLCRLFPQKREQILTQFGLSGRRYFDKALLSGGTLVNSLGYQRVRFALKAGLALRSLGTGVGSCGLSQPNSIDIQAWKPLLKDFDRIGVRGFRSQEALNRLGIDNVETIGDLALWLTPDRLPEPTHERKFVLNARPLDCHYGMENDANLQGLKAAVQALIRQGWQPVPVAMHPSDRQAIASVLATSPFHNSPIPLIRDIREFFQVVQACQFCVGVRLHSAVLCACVGVPPLLLGYRGKCLDFMESMHLELWHHDLQGAPAGEITEKALLLSEMAPTLRQQIWHRALLWKQTIASYVADTDRCFEAKEVRSPASIALTQSSQR